jgi:hypothetical protein
MSPKRRLSTTTRQPASAQGSTIAQCSPPLNSKLSEQSLVIADLCRHVGFWQDSIGLLVENECYLHDVPWT